MKVTGRRYGDARKARMFYPTLNRWLRELEPKLATAASAGVDSQTLFVLCSKYLPVCAKSGKYEPEPATTTAQNPSNVEPHHRLVSRDPKAVVLFVAYPISHHLYGASYLGNSFVSISCVTCLCSPRQRVVERVKRDGGGDALDTELPDIVVRVKPKAYLFHGMANDGPIVRHVEVFVCVQAPYEALVAKERQARQRQTLLPDPSLVRHATIEAVPPVVTARRHIHGGTAE